MDGNFKDPDVKWFARMRKLNITKYFCERHLYYDWRSAAIIWEAKYRMKLGRTLTYSSSAFHEVNRFANALKSKGIGKGDKVIIYMPMVPEAAIRNASLCPIGAITRWCLPGFSSNAWPIGSLIAEAKPGLTSGRKLSRNKTIGLTKIPSGWSLGKILRRNVIRRYQRTKQEVTMKSGETIGGMDVIESEFWSKLYSGEMDSEDMLSFSILQVSNGQSQKAVHNYRRLYGLYPIFLWECISIFT